MIDVLITGAAGRMGSEVVKAVSAADGMRVVAAVDPANHGVTVSDGNGGLIACTVDLAAAIREHSPDVMVDFTHPSVVESNLVIALGAGVDCVVGTTGLPETRLAELAEGAPAGTCLFMAPNFAIGAILMMRFAAQAARYMPHVEIIELHHDQKADAPSGTAMLTAGLISQARATVPDAPGRETEIAEGARGASVQDVTVHSVRLPGMVAHQEVLFGGQGQTLTLRHDSIDRTSFMPGVILACRQVGAHAGLLIGLDRFMEA